MPSDKRDGARKSDRASSSGSSSRPSATVTSDSVPAVPSTSSRTGVTTSSSGTVRSVSSMSNAKRSGRECAVVSSHSAPALSSASVYDRANFSGMPNIVDDACDDMLSDDNVAGASRAPLSSLPTYLSDSRERRLDDCWRDSGCRLRM